MSPAKRQGLVAIQRFVKARGRQASFIRTAWWVAQGASLLELQCAAWRWDDSSCALAVATGTAPCHRKLQRLGC